MRILLVDDEAGVLQAHMAILKTIPGHDVRVAANAAKALDHAAALGGVELLISDVVMDPVDGFTLRDELLALYPEMRTVFVSGYDLSDYAERIEGSTVLAKPVDADALRAAIANAEGVPAAAVASVIPVEPAEIPQPVAVQPLAEVALAVSVPLAGEIFPSVQETVLAPAKVSAQPRPAVPAPAKEVVRPMAGRPAAVPAAAPAAPTVRVVPQIPAAALRAVPSSSAAPSAVPPAQPPATARAPVPAPAPVASSDPLIGVQLGDYRVQQLLGRGNWGKVYTATQLSVSRRVGLNVLDPVRAEQEHNRVQFLADARAKAAVQHPFIMSVFEADERNGLVFYTHESLDGASLQERIERSQFLDEKTALQVVKNAGEALQYLWSHNLAHGPVGAEAIRVGADQIARLENIAAAETDSSVTMEGEIRTVGAIMQQLVPENSLSGGFRALLGRMIGGANPVTSWPLVLQAVKALEPKVIPVEAAKIKAADAAAMRAQEAARNAKKKTLYFSIVTLAVLALMLTVVVWKFLISNARKLDAQVLIPAGSYIVGSPEFGGKANLGAYEIDKYEVTINEYAKFIAWCEKNPAREHEFDHPRGERKNSHINDEVKILIQNAFVRGKRVFKQEADPGVEVDLNSPMVAVTFWDAYAYAHWRGKILESGTVRDLPTEEEWEVAARGPKGYKYPWGDELKPKNFNSNQGYQPLAPGGTKTDDGFNYWAPVDAFTSDVSEFKVMGMAGNVSEWVYRKEGSKEIPLLKGASFASDPIPMWGRILKIPAEDAWFVFPASMKPRGQYFVGDDVTASTRSLYIGFRTVKRK